MLVSDSVNQSALTHFAICSSLPGISQIGFCSRCYYRLKQLTESRKRETSFFFKEFWLQWQCNTLAKNAIRWSPFSSSPGAASATSSRSKWRKLLPFLKGSLRGPEVVKTEPGKGYVSRDRTKPPSKLKLKTARKKYADRQRIYGAEFSAQFRRFRRRKNLSILAWIRHISASATRLQGPCSLDEKRLDIVYLRTFARTAS